MCRSYKVAVVSVTFLLVVSLPAFASSSYNFSNQKLTGSSGSNLSGSFTFTGTASGGTFSNLSLSFNGGAFAGINASDVSGGKATCSLGFCGFSWKTQVSGGWVWNTIVLNVSTGQYWDLGKIYNWQNQWNFDPMPVPEGGAELTYLMLSGIAVFGGILISSRRRRTTRLSQSG